MSEIKFVACRPDGSICGPMGDTHDFVVLMLCEGHRRAGGSGIWADILNMGYRIKKAKLTILEGEDGKT